MVTHAETDLTMYEAGRRFKIIIARKRGVSQASTEVRYAQSLSAIPIISPKGAGVFITPLRKDWQLRELFEMWGTGMPADRKKVIRILHHEHPALTALFLAQGVADGHLTRSSLNEVANQLSEFRQEEFRLQDTEEVPVG